VNPLRIRSGTLLAVHDIEAMAGCKQAAARPGQTEGTEEMNARKDAAARQDAASPQTPENAARPGARAAAYPVESHRVLRPGYSLMEVLIAVAIIALLAALIAPRLFGQLDASQVTAARTQIRMIETALDSFRLDIGRYPTEEEGLAVLAAPPPELVDRWNGPYLDGGLPVDPWGAPYRYRPAQTLARRGAVYSYGADGQPGGEGPAADIYSRGAGPDDLPDAGS